MNEKSAVKNFYKERQKFVILGLTGRTGSGCSTVAKILEESNFNMSNPEHFTPPVRV